MITQISIENYKCFQNTSIEGFERVNLIGGLNNSGKTVLLEALHLIDGGLEDKIVYHKMLRGEDNTVNLSDFSYKGIEANNITISINNAEFELELSSKEISENIHHKYKFNSHIRINGKIFYYSARWENTNKFDNSIANFISPSEKFNSNNLVLEYNKAEDKQQEHRVVEFLKIIDSSITDIRVSIQGSPHLRVKKGNEGVMPLTALGDAAKKVARIALCVLNGEHKAIFIDEIENGIHYTAHREFWKLLFHIAETLDVQIFATTHSLEMIKAYHDVAKKDNVKGATYFELFRHGKTYEIVGRKFDMEKLEYNLERNLEIRGE